MVLADAMPVAALPAVEDEDMGTLALSADSRSISKCVYSAGRFV